MIGMTGEVAGVMSHDLLEDMDKKNGPNDASAVAVLSIAYKRLLKQRVYRSFRRSYANKQSNITVPWESQIWQKLIIYAIK